MERLLSSLAVHTVTPYHSTALSSAVSRSLRKGLPNRNGDGEGEKEAWDVRRRAYVAIGRKEGREALLRFISLPFLYLLPQFVLPNRDCGARVLYVPHERGPSQGKMGWMRDGYWSIGNGRHTKLEECMGLVAATGCGSWWWSWWWRGGGGGGNGNGGECLK